MALHELMALKAENSLNIAQALDFTFFHRCLQGSSLNLLFMVNCAGYSGKERLTLCKS
jgi:hypothetical protein